MRNHAKKIVVVLFLALLCLLNASYADSWTCEKCMSSTYELFTTCSNCHKPLGETSVFLVIDFKDNWFFSKYDVNMKIDNGEAFSLMHGKDIKLHLRLANGKHNLTFIKSDDKTRFSEVEFDVTNDCEYKCRIETNRSGISIKDVSQKAVVFDDLYSYNRIAGRRAHEYLNLCPATHRFTYHFVGKHVSSKNESKYRYGSYSEQYPYIILHFDESDSILEREYLYFSCDLFDDALIECYEDGRVKTDVNKFRHN